MLVDGVPIPHLQAYISSAFFTETRKYLHKILM